MLHGAYRLATNAMPTVPAVTFVLTVGAGQGSHDDSAGPTVKKIRYHFERKQGSPYAKVGGLSEAIRRHGCQGRI